MNIRIGMDFGTTYIYIGFVHGTDPADGRPNVERLVSAQRKTAGIPALYYNDGTNEYFAERAGREGLRNPEYLLSSVKLRTAEKQIRLGTEPAVMLEPQEVIRKLMRYALEEAEKILHDSYAAEPEGFDVVLTVPVDFDNAQRRTMRDALAGLRLESGIEVQGVIVVQEPVAAAVRFLGIRHDPGEYALVVDIGGGTADVALLHDRPTGDSPYRVIDQGGDRSLGGNNWDARMRELLEKKLLAQTGMEKVPEKLEGKLRRLAREMKEQFGETETASGELTYEDTDYSFSVCLADFTARTQDLLERAAEQVRRVLIRQQDKNITDLILTGGSCYLPPLREIITGLAELPGNIRVSLFRPERAVAEGAAILASHWPVAPKPADIPVTQENIPPETPVPEKTPAPYVEQIAPHGCGILVRVPERKNELMLRVLFLKGEPLPAQGTFLARCEVPATAYYAICETDVLTEGSDPYDAGSYIVINGARYTAAANGREVCTLPYTPGTAGELAVTVRLDDSLLLAFAGREAVTGRTFLFETLMN